MVHLAIVGSRQWTSDGAMKARRLIDKVLDAYKPDLVISGGAPAVDSWAESAAKRRGIPVVSHRPKRQVWEEFKARDRLIAEDCTHLVCIRSIISKSYGSGWTADEAERLGKPVVRHLL